MQDKRKVVIDCDPGIDDCFALMLAFKHLDVVALTTVGGNTGLENTSRNACYMAELLGHPDVPVYAGYDRPMIVELEKAEYVHGATGLGPIETVEPKKQVEKKHAVDAIIDLFMNHDDLYLVTLGPLTNIAHAILKEPKLKGKIKEILCMGGSVTRGNCTSNAEFNIYADAEAAKIVFESGILIKMAGLNYTRQNSMNQDDLEVIKNIDNKVAKVAAELLGFSVNNYMQSELCDACTIAWEIDPTIVPVALPMHIDVETKGEFTRGMTVCDYREYIGTDPKIDIDRETHFKVADLEKNALVAMEFDQARFKELLFSTIKSYDI